MIKDLIKPSDIRLIEKKSKETSLTPQEAALLREASMSESKIQIVCHNMIKALFLDKALFVQIDNGGAMGIGQKMKKKAEGTQAGYPDVMILTWGNDKNKIIFIEFKKIGGKPTEKQLYWHNFLKEKGESVHFCNNTPYFEAVIVKEIEEFLNE